MEEFLERVRDWIDRAKEVLANKTARYVLIAVVIVVLALLMVGKSSGGQDVLVLESGGDRIVLEKKTCTSEAKAVFRSDVPTLTATYVIGKAKKTVAGCYAIMETPQHGPVIFLFFEDGDRYAIPLDKFKPGDISAKRVGLLI